MKPNTKQLYPSAKALALAVATLTLTLASQSARAQVVSYEGFNYTAGTQLIGTGSEAGGTGWGSTWSATGAALATNVSPSLAYGDLTTTGGSVVIGVPNGPSSTTASVERLLPDTLGDLAAANSAAVGTIWISLLYQNLNATTTTGASQGFRQANLGLFSGATLNANGSANVNGTERMDVGTPNTYQAPGGDALSLWPSGASASAVSSGIATPRGSDPLANTVFVLLELNVDNTTAADTITAWFNPSLTTQPTSGGISIGSVDLSAVNALRLQAGNQNANGTNAFFQADELTVGDTFADVTPQTVPEPGVISLGLLGIFAFAFVARRKWNAA